MSFVFGISLLITGDIDKRAIETKKMIGFID